MGIKTYNENEYDIIYVDPSSETAGDGSTYESPLKQLPSTLENNKCYLIRRTSSEKYVEISNSTNTNLINFMIMGMPKSSDEEYSLITDESLKLAWEDINENYANVLCNNMLQIDNIKNLSLTRCYFFRTTKSTATTNIGPKPMFLRNMNATNISFMDDIDVKINYCKFGHYNFDMNDEEFRNSTEYDSNGYTYYCKRYVILNQIGNFTLKNTIIDYCSYVGSVYWTDTSVSCVSFYSSTREASVYQSMNNAIYASPSKLTIIENNVVNCLFSKDSSVRHGDSNNVTYISLLSSFGKIEGYYINHTYYRKQISPNSAIIIEGKGGLINCNNLKINHILYSDNYLPSYPLIITSTDANKLYLTNMYNSRDYRSGSQYDIKLKMENININVLTFKNAIPSNNYKSFKEFCNSYSSYLTQYDEDRSNYIGSIILHGRFNGYVSNINVENNLLNCLSAICVDDFNTDGYNEKNNFKIKNVKASCSQSIGTSVGYDSLYYQPSIIYVKKEEYINNTLVNEDQTNDIYIIENIDLNCPFGTGVNINNSNISNCNIKGKVFLGNNVFGNIHNIINGDLKNPHVYIYGNNNDIIIDNLTLDYDNSYNTNVGLPKIYYDESLNYYGKSKIKVGYTNTNIVLETSKTSTNYLDDGYIVCPNYGSNGQFIQKNSIGKISSCSVQRNGSVSNASLKFELSGNIDNSYEQILGSENYDALHLTSNTGLKTIKVYLYTEQNIDSKELLNGLRIYLENINNNSDTDIFSSAISNIDGQVLDDISQWNNISDGYAKLITIPFNVISSDNPIKVIISNNISNKGSIYLDPNIEIE